MENFVFKVESSDLLSALQTVKHAMGNKNNPLFYKIAFFVAKGTLTVEAANGYMLMRKFLPVRNDNQETKSFALHGKLFLDAVRKLDRQELTVEVHEYQVVVNHSYGRFFLQTDDINEYTDVTSNMVQAGTYSVVETESPCLLSVLGKCKFAMADDYLRPAMSGVCLDIDDTHTNFVASDGHVLMCIKKDSLSSETPAKIIIPRDVVGLLTKTLPKTGFVSVTYSEGVMCGIRLDDTEYLFERVDGRYPNYGSVIPTHFTQSVKVDRTELLGSIGRLVLFSNNKKFRMCFANDTLKLSSLGEDNGADETLKISYQGEDFRIAFNGEDFVKTLKNIGNSSEVVVKFSGANGVAIIEPVTQPQYEEVSVLLMPMYDSQTE